MEAFKLWCFNDAHDKGAALARKAAERGHDAHLFEDPREPDAGFVFMYMHHHPQVRLMHKRVNAILAMNPLLTLIPDQRMADLYDDKIKQAQALSRYMPRTHLFYTPGAARKYIETTTYPFVSKGSEGAGSHNVRIVETMDAAKHEVRQAFSDLGIKSKSGQTQRGYLLWQDFVPDNCGDVRVLAIGHRRLMLKRTNRTSGALSSANAVSTPVTAFDDELLAALRYANEFFDREGVNWGGVDLIRCAITGRFYMLECTVSWTMHAYYDSAFIVDRRDGAQFTKVMGHEIWSVLIDELEAGAFGDERA